VCCLEGLEKTNGRVCEKRGVPESDPWQTASKKASETDLRVEAGLDRGRQDLYLCAIAVGRAEKEE